MFRDKFALRTSLRFFEVCGRFLGVKVGVANFILGQS